MKYKENNKDSFPLNCENEICWVFGPTASGKKTLIINTIHKNTILNEKLNNFDCVIIPIILYVQFIEKDNKLIKNTEKRHDIIHSYYKNYQHTYFKSLYLIHGQLIDLKFLNRLHEKYKNDMKNCFFIHIDKNEYKNRCKKRNLNISYEDAYKNKNSIIKQLKKYFNNVHVITI